MRARWILVVSISLIGACKQAKKAHAREHEASLASMVTSWGGTGVANGILDLRKAHLTAQRLHDALAHDDASSLIALNISSTNVGNAGLAAIAASPHLGKIDSAWANQIGADSDGARTLARAATLRPKLLSLVGNHIGPEGATALAGSAVMINLEHLNLSLNPIEDAGVRAIATANAPALDDLQLDGVGLDGQGVGAIFSPKTLTNLTSLSLSSNSIPASAFEALRDPAVLPKLESLDIDGITLPDSLRADLAQRRPKLKIAP